MSELSESQCDAPRDRSPLHAAHYADEALHQSAMVLENCPVARSTWRIRCEVPEMARRIRPGQFVMLRVAGRSDPLLGRPFALYDVCDDVFGEPYAIDLVYLVSGKMTQAMSLLNPGDQVEIWGPLGNGFPIPQCEHLVLVAGGIGQTPFLAVTRQALGQRGYGGSLPRPTVRKVTLCYGTRNAEFFAGLSDFERGGAELFLATDDGSRGTPGLVTQVLERTLAPEQVPRPTHPEVFCCGPEPMMAAAAAICARLGVRCWVSLETPMACGIGACYTCVAPIRENNQMWDYKRTCVEGPIFEASKVEWLPHA